MRIDTVGTERRLTARIGNAGNAVAGAGTPVSFYDGNPLLGGLKLGTTALSAHLAAGSFEDVELLVDVSTMTESSIWVVADDFGGLIGTVSESDEDNNAFDSGLSLVGASGAGLADLAISSVDTTALDVDSSTLDVTGTLAATVRNQGEQAVSGPFDVVFFEDANANGTYEPGVDVELGVALVDGATTLDVGASVAAVASASGTVLFAGNLIYAFADSGLVVTESNEANNVSSSGADSVATLSGGASDMSEEWSWTSSSSQPNYRNISTSPVVADLTGDGVADIAPASIPVSLYNGNPALGFPLLTTVNTASTLAPGSFEDVSFQFPSTTLGEDTLYAVADDDGTTPLAPVGIVVESNEDNNVHDTGLALNLEPVVGAGEDVVLDFPDATTTLQGSVSDDGLPLGAPFTTTWQVVLGPLGSDLQPPLFVDQTAPVTDVTFQLAGTYVLRLVADDSRRIGSDEVTVLVGEENLPPVVDAGPDADVELPNTVLTMAASVTDDGLPLGAFLDIHWTQISGPAVVSFVDTANPSTDVTFPVAGTYILSLQGREVLATSDSVVITVHPVNQGPVVSAGADQTIFSPTTILQGSASDADGLPIAGSLATTWSQVSAPGPVVFTDVSDVGTSVSLGVTGTYVFRLTADDGALIAADDVTIEVDITNAPPLVEAGADQTIVFPTSSTILSGTVTDDGLPAGSSIFVVWNLLSAPAAVVYGDQFATTTTVSFTAGGTYLFRLDASDTDLLGNDTVTVVVDDGNVAPVPNAGADQNILLPTNTVTLTGSATDDGLPSGSVLTYRWTTASGPALADFTSPSAPTTW